MIFPPIRAEVGLITITRVVATAAAVPETAVALQPEAAEAAEVAEVVALVP
jgi:hypothetical protein